MANLEQLEKSLPYAPIKIVALESSKYLSDEVNEYLVGFRHDIKSRITSIETIQKQIERYRLLEYQLINSSNALNDFTAAQNGSSYEDLYEVGNTAYKTLIDGIKNAGMGKADVEAAIRALVPEDVIDKGAEAISKYVKNSLNRYFGEEDADYYKGLSNFLKDLISHGLMDDNGQLVEGLTSDIIGKTLGITSDAATALMEALESLEYGRQFNWSIVSDGERMIEELSKQSVELAKTKNELIESGNWSGENKSNWLTAYYAWLAENKKAASMIYEDIEDYRTAMTEYDQLTKRKAELDSIMASGKGTAKEKEELADIIEKLREIELKAKAPTQVEIQFVVDDIDEKLAALDPSSQE